MTYSPQDDGSDIDAATWLIMKNALRDIAAGCIGRKPGHCDYHKNRTKDEIYQIAITALDRTAGTP